MVLRWVALALICNISIFSTIFAGVKPTASQVPLVNHQQSAIKALKIVKNRADLIRWHGQEVELIGRYTAKTWKPDPRLTGIANFQGLYVKSQIELEDGTLVNIFPSWNKQSLRSPDEAEDYEQKVVSAIGVVQVDAKPSANATSSESLINLVKLRLHLQESKLYDPRSVVQVLENQPGILLDSWRFTRQWETNQPEKPLLWGVTREYELEMRNAPTNQSKSTSHKFQLMLGRNLPSPPRPKITPLPNGEQVTFAEGGVPNHVTALRLSYARTGESLKPGANWLPETFKPTLLTIAQNCFDADESEVAVLTTQITQTVERWQTTGGMQHHRQHTPRLGIYIDADVSPQRLSVLLWRIDEPGDRRIYCDLEPRNVKITSGSS